MLWAIIAISLPSPSNLSQGTDLRYRLLDAMIADDISPVCRYLQAMSSPTRLPEQAVSTVILQ